MEIIQTIVVIASIFISLIILDFIWLGIITKQFIISQFGSLIETQYNSIKIKLAYGLLAWFAIALGVFIFAVNPADTLSKTIILAATFGFISYAIYDLTNATFIKNYPIKFVFVDILWGTVLCSAISVVGFFVKRLF